MNKLLFLKSAPWSIEHDTWGYSVLEILVDSKISKGACYRNKDKIASFATYGKSWQEVITNLINSLKENKVIK